MEALGQHVLHSTVDTATVGTYGVNYTSTDQAGNSTTITRVVDVVTVPVVPPAEEPVPPVDPPVTP
jgi:hypothetical protein